MQTKWLSDVDPIQYILKMNRDEWLMNELIGKTINLSFTGKINCINCHRDIQKTFAQGYCYPCFTSLAETDSCIVSPHLCHHHLGTCRDNDFAEKHCFIPHTVYLAVSSDAKVGITRAFQKHSRWADQGATAAIELAEVPSRKHAGELELKLSTHISDRTNWRKMLSNEVPDIDLTTLRTSLIPFIPESYRKFISQADPIQLKYPVTAFPKKISSLDLEKNPSFTEKLAGIKGQYLIFDSKVINMRKYQGYEIALTL